MLELRRLTWNVPKAALDTIVYQKMRFKYDLQIVCQVKSQQSMRKVSGNVRKCRRTIPYSIIRL